MSYIRCDHLVGGVEYSAPVYYVTVEGFVKIILPILSICEIQSVLPIREAIFWSGWNSTDKFRKSGTFLWCGIIAAKNEPGIFMESWHIHLYTVNFRIIMVSTLLRAGISDILLVSPSGSTLKGTGNLEEDSDSTAVVRILLLQCFCIHGEIKF